jgi:hypothetical protein
MVDKKRIAKYEVYYPTYVRVSLNEDLTIISHQLDYTLERAQCYELGWDDQDSCYERVNMVDTDGTSHSVNTEYLTDYQAVMGNAYTYVNGLRLVLGHPNSDNNTEPF